MRGFTLQRLISASHGALSTLDPTSPDRVPYFHVTSVGGRVVAQGAPSCSLGHRITRRPDRKPDGVYADWQWDGRRLTVENDRHGMFPLFYFTRGDEFCVSPSIFTLLARGAPTEINWPALAVFLRIGFYVGEDTAFAAVRALPPNATLQWQDGRLLLSGGYHFPKPLHVSRPSAIEGYVALFKAAVECRIPDHDDFAVPLSGGRDSRHILLELCARGRPPRYCITGRRYPPALREDERIAAVVAAEVGVKHVIVGPPDDHIGSLVRANIKTNLTAPRRGWKLAVADYLKETVSVSYDGIGGDMLSGAASFDRSSLPLLDSGRLDEYCRRVLRRADGVLRRLVPAAQHRLISAEVATSRLEVELRRHLDAPNPGASFNFWNRTRRFNSTSAYGICADLPTVYSPFLDHDLYDFLTSVQANGMFDREFHDDVIRAAYPRHRDLPFERQETPRPLTRWQTFSKSADLATWVLRNRPRRLVNQRFVLGKLAAGLSVGVSPLSWLIPPVVYLTQLEAAAFARAAVHPIGSGGPVSDEARPPSRGPLPTVPHS
jgi:hypothetical protein